MFWPLTTGRVVLIVSDRYSPGYLWQKNSTADTACECGAGQKDARQDLPGEGRERLKLAEVAAGHLSGFEEVEEGEDG